MGAATIEIKDVYQSFILHEIRQALDKLFSAVDTAVFNMAGKASSNIEQNQHYESVQCLRIGRHVMFDHYNRMFNCNLHQIEPQLSEDIEHVDSLKKLLKITEDSWKADSQLVISLIDLQSRIDEAQQHVGNPLEPRHFLHNFLVSLANTDINMRTKMLIIRMFETSLYGKLGVFVRAMNNTLSKAGLLPDLQTTPGAATVTMNAVVDLGEVDTTSSVDSGVGAILVELQIEDYKKIDELLSDDSLLAWQYDKPIRNVKLDVESHKGLPTVMPIGARVELEKIDLVYRLFQLILSDNGLPAVAKGIINTLQVTYAQIAIRDEEFFKSDRHPAKTLLNEMTKSCMNWSPNVGEFQADDFFEVLSVIVRIFLGAKRVELIDYETCQFELLAYAETQRQKDALTTRRLIESEYGVSVAEHARKHVEELLDETLHSNQLPAAALRILKEAWNNVLYMCALKHGVDSDDWQEMVAVVDKLVDTFHSIESYCSRAEFLQKIPTLLGELKEGFLLVGMDSRYILELLAGLEIEHKRIAVAISSNLEGAEIVDVSEIDRQAKDYLNNKREKIRQRRKVLKEAIAAKVPETVNAYRTPKQENVEKNSKKEAVDSVNNLSHTLKNLRQGASLLWRKEGEQVRCRVAAHIKHMHKYILTDRSGNKIAEFSEDTMAAMMLAKEIEVFDADQVFDKALESVIGGIRDRR